MHTPAEAARVMLEQLEPLAPRRVALRSALDRALAEDVTSPIDLPPWDNSAMDGYACRAADLQGNRIELRVVETVAAGKFPRQAIGPGEATRIFTGAPLPQGADTVIRQEDTQPVPPDRVVIENPRDSGKNIRRAGEDIRKGTTVLRAGAQLGPAQLGVLASIVHSRPLVHPTPRVAFLGSGDEIASLSNRKGILSGKKVASSNSYTLDAMIRRAGAVPNDVGIARDTKQSLRAHFAKARGADLIITSAGVSVGEHDLVRDVLAELGGKVRMWRIKMRPGAPVGFGSLYGVPWLGLPGNPVSTMVTFELFVRPVIRRLQGHALPFRRTVPVTLAEPITLGPRLRHYLRAIVSAEPDGTLSARLTGPQGSGILTSMARANALLIVPEDQSTVALGARLDALVLDDPHHVAAPPY